MNRLFWKLFLSFWLALVLFAGATLVAASIYLDRTQGRHDVTSPNDRPETPLVAAQAAADGGLDSLRSWAQKMDAGELVPLLVLDQEGRDLLQREVSPRALSHWNRHRLSPPPGPNDDRPMRPVVHLPDGQEFGVIPDFQGVNLGRFLSRPRVLAIPLILATLAAGLVCLLLARYLTAPLERLRAAALDYANGNFSRRVGASIGGRQDEVADLALAMDHMAERLSRLIEAQQSLLRDVSHELRTPLARLQAALGLARQRGAVAERELDRIERESERLGDLIGGILSFSRLDSGMQPLLRESIDLAQLLRETVFDTTIEAEGQGCRLELQAPQEAPTAGDPALLHSAIENVLRNAVRHSPRGAAVNIALATTESGYRIDIEDRGPGVPEEMLARIFEPFVRVDDSREAASGGFGLGLAIARRAMAAHNGAIAASNRKDGGLSVHLSLPLAPI